MSKLDLEGFDNRLREARLANGLSQRTVSDIIERSEAYVQLLERGSHAPSVPVLVALCYALNISPNALLQDSLPENMFGELPFLRALRFRNHSPSICNTLSNWLDVSAPDECMIHDAVRSEQHIDLQKLPRIGFLGLQDEMPESRF